ncbi:coagulation factor VII isoform X2 [Cololabis saira]|nr:coagulation factor VII isoform X2 [Cololabis saira]
MLPADLQRECYEERCSPEEASEIFLTREKTLEFWYRYKNLNVCGTNPCLNGGICTMDGGDFLCLCPPQHRGRTCDTVVTECSYRNGGCLQYCRDLPGGAGVQCGCADGFTLDSDGKRCSPTERFPCGHEALYGGRSLLDDVTMETDPKVTMETDSNVIVETDSNVTMETDDVADVNVTMETNAAADVNVTHRWNLNATEPLEANTTSGPVEANATSGPVQANATEPVEANATSGLVEANATSGPVEANATEPVEANATEPVEANATEPVEANATEPVEANTTSGPLEGNRTELGVGLGAEPEEEAESEDDLRIVGGNLVKRGGSPWQVLIHRSDGFGFCGGTLVADRWVVSAAHCFEDKADYITTGDYDKQRPDAAEQLIKIQQIFLHPHFHSFTFDSDVALLFLAQPVLRGATAVPACLPDPHLSKYLLRDKNVGVVSGWGATQYLGKSSRFLRKVSLPVVNNQACEATTEQVITDNMFCAGYLETSIDACSGDSGGPFVVNYRGTWFLTGVVSWGERCAARGKYGVYTRLGNFLSWIRETMETTEQDVTRS